MTQLILGHYAFRVIAQRRQLYNNGLQKPERIKMKTEWSTCRCDGHMVDYICKACKSPVVFIPDNTGLPQFDGDWIYYCCNKGCINHAGESIFQNEPDWCEKKEK